MIAGQSDELTRLTIQQQEILKQFDNFKKETAAKDDELRTLQTSMGEMQTENERLKSENDSKSNRPSVSLLDRYYSDVFGHASVTRRLLNLENNPPSETALEGTLVTLQILYARPIEFSGSTKVMDLLADRPITKFAKDIPSFTDLGLDTTNPEHAFFADCYLKFHTDPSFCKDGTFDISAPVVSLPPGGAFPPRASIIQKMPRKF